MGFFEAEAEGEGSQDFSAEGPALIIESERPGSEAREVGVGEVDVWVVGVGGMADGVAFLLVGCVNLRTQAEVE